MVDNGIEVCVDYSGLTIESHPRRSAIQSVKGVFFRIPVVILHRSGRQVTQKLPYLVFS